MTKYNKLLKNIIVCLFWFIVWEIIARHVGKNLLLPAPSEVLPRLAVLITTAQFWEITALSLGRVFAGVVGAIILGALLAMLTSRVKLLDSLFSPLIAVIRATPVASFIVLAILWLGRDFVPCLIAALMVLPVVWTNVSTGIKNTDPNLLEMAHCFRFSTFRKLRRVYIPSVMPHFLSACRISLGLGWKAGITAEVLTVPAKSIGKLLSDSKLYMETTDLFAWTLVIIVCSLIIEKLVMVLISVSGKSYMTGGGAK